MKTLIAGGCAVAVVLAVGTAIAFASGGDSGPDPYAGAYPLITPTRTPTASPYPTWHPSGRPAGPLPTFPGTGSRVVGRITDRSAGVSYARLASPWKPLAGRTGGQGSGQEINGKIKDYDHFWYVAVYSGPADPRFDVPGPNRLRAAAELVGQDFVKQLYSTDGRRTDIAGAPRTIDGHSAWVTAFRMTHVGATRVMKSQTMVIVAVDTGRPRPAIVKITVPNNQERHLPDITTVIGSLRVIR